MANLEGCVYSSESNMTYRIYVFQCKLCFLNTSGTWRLTVEQYGCAKIPQLCAIWLRQIDETKDVWPSEMQHISSSKMALLACYSLRI